MAGKRFGEIIVESGKISNAALEDVLKSRPGRGNRLGEELLNRGLVNEEDVAKALGTQFAMPFVALDSETLDPEVVHLIPRNIAEELGVIAVRLDKDVLVVAMSDPMDIQAFDSLRAQLDCPMKPAVAPKGAVYRAIRMYYDMSSTIRDVVSKATQESLDFASGIEEVADQDEEEGPVEEVGAPIVVLVNTILRRAVESVASDIHIEPEEETTRVRFRVDGMLKTALSLPRKLHNAIVSRVKILSHLDISERRRPQDGRCKIRLHEKMVDLRMSILPTLLGEKVVVRILDQTQVVRSLEELGMQERELEAFEASLRRTKGVVLVTGPTGCGKTTTLYAALKRLLSDTQNIVTVEDPVEYRLAGISQIQINSRVGVTFASGLRSILRQDPDIIMVGEIRDFETAEIAVQAALTGHLVLSTMHTNDAPSAITRLRDMGVEPFLIAATVECAVAQRLVRLICPNCKEQYEPSPQALRNLGLDSSVERKFYRGKGCPGCFGTGYRGRSAVFELMSVHQRAREKIAARASLAELTTLARENGMRSLLENALQKAFEGQTSLEEVLRVVEEAQDRLPFCPKCLEPVNVNFLACPFCGEKLREPQAICQKCQRELSPNWHVCPYCREKTSENSAH